MWREYKMDVGSSILTALLFAAFVPGVLVTLPPKGGRRTVIAVHALAFAVVACLVVDYYRSHIQGFVEGMGNYGPTCPNGYIMSPDENCVAVGHATADASTGFKSA
jgi:hypothetical protein